MADQLVFPRIIYRGLPDHLGQGPHDHPETGERVGETKRVDSQDELDAALNEGWRLTREDPEAEDEAEGGDGSAAGDDAGAGTSRAKSKAKAKAKAKK